MRIKITSVTLIFSLVIFSPSAFSVFEFDPRGKYYRHVEKAGLCEIRCVTQSLFMDRTAPCEPTGYYLAYPNDTSDVGEKTLAGARFDSKTPGSLCISPKKDVVKKSKKTSSQKPLEKPKISCEWDGPPIDIGTGANCGKQVFIASLKCINEKNFEIKVMAACNLRSNEKIDPTKCYDPDAEAITSATSQLSKDSGAVK